MAKQAKATPTVPSIPKNGVKGTTVPSVPKLPPKHVKATPHFEIVESAKMGFHWVLMLPEKEARNILAGHVGPNPKTREEALKQIEAFKQTVAQAQVKL